MEIIEILILVLSFLTMLSVGVPIAYSIGLSSLFTLLVSMDPLTASTTIAQRMGTGLDSFGLLAVPFFILAGQLMNQGGIAERLINFAKALIGWLPGGLAHVNIIANMLFGAISGSAVAAASAIGGVMHERMVEEGYDEEVSSAVNISSATTGLIIPPSNVLIVYSLASGGASIGALFVAGYIPGILVGLALMGVAAYFAITRKYPKEEGPSFAKLLRGIVYNLPSIVVLAGILWFSNFLWKTGWGTDSLLSGIGSFGALGIIWTAYISLIVILRRGNRPAVSSKLLLRYLITGLTVEEDESNEQMLLFAPLSQTFLDAIPSLLLLIIVIGGIIAGIFTATEASAVAVLYSLILAFLYREISWNDLPDILLSSVKTTSIVMILVATSMAMSWVMAFENIPQNVSELLLSISNNKIVVLMIINLLLLFVGIFMDITPAVLIFTPIFLPVVTELGMDPVHFGIVMVLNLCIGLCTPPVGSVLFVGSAVSKVSISRVIRPLLPMFIAMIIALILVTYIPALSIWLPSFFGMM